MTTERIECAERLESIQHPQHIFGLYGWEPAAPVHKTAALLLREADARIAECGGYSDEDYNRLHRAHCATEQQRAEAVAEIGRLKARIAELEKRQIKVRWEEVERLVRSVYQVIDRHIEQKEGSNLAYFPAIPREFKEIRSAIEPFRTHIAKTETPRAAVEAEAVKMMGGE